MFLQFVLPKQEHATGGGLSRILDPGPISDPSNFLLMSQTRKCRSSSGTTGAPARHYCVAPATAVDTIPVEETGKDC